MIAHPDRPPLNLDGYTDLPEGKIALIVTFLEMKKAPQKPLPAPRAGLVLRPWISPRAADYVALFREIGTDWLWFGRLAQAPDQLEAILRRPNLEVFIAERDGKAAGLLEIDYADPENPEVAYFGLVPSAIGAGAGRWLMAQAMEQAWARQETRRVWLHTCTADSPKALGFYQSCGFVPYKMVIEIADDPRLRGLLPEDAAPHIPLIRPSA